MTALKLYELSDALEQVADTLQDNGGELTPELATQLEQLEGAFSDKAERVALKLLELQFEAGAVKQEIARLAALASSRERAAERLKSYLLACLEHAGLTTVEGSRVRLRIHANSQPTIQWVGPDDAIPEAFRKTTVTVAVDKAKAHEAVKAGATLPDGFRVERGHHLRIV